MTLNDPFAGLPEVPTFTVTSTSVAHEQPLSAAQFSARSGVPGGRDASPQLTWTGAPEGAKSFAVTVYDPDAPTMSGVWHWAVANIPGSTTSLPEGAGDDTGSGLPDGALQVPNDARAARFMGVSPPAGHGPHRYFITVHALDVDALGVTADSTPAFLGYAVSAHILARATIVATAEAAAD